MTEPFRPWRAYIEPNRNSIPIGRSEDDCPILIDGRHMKDPDRFALELVRLLNARYDWLLSLQTRTTRYKANDGRERAVLIWEDYELILKLAGCDGLTQAL